MARFEPFTMHTLNKMFNDHFIDELKTDFNEILPLIISGMLKIPKSNEVNNSLFDNLHIDECKFQKQLTTTRQINGISNKVGFNKLVILSMFLNEDVKYLLDDLDDQHTVSSIHLSKLKSVCGDNIIYGKLLSQLSNGFSRMLINPTFGDELPYQMFKYIYNYIQVEDYEYTHDTMVTFNKISFLYLYEFMLLYLSYSKITQWQTDTFYHISDNNRLPSSQVGEELQSYFDDNSINFINSVGDYCYTNIFMLSYNYSTLFDNVVDGGLVSSFSNLFSIFNDNLDAFIDPSFTSKMLFEIAEQICFNTANYWLTHETEGFYDYFPNLHNEEIFASLTLDEDAIYSSVTEYLTENLEVLEQLEYISFQFNSTPIFFINSYIYLHYVYASDMIDEMKLTINVANWIDKFEYVVDRNERLNSYLETHPFVYDATVIDRVLKCNFNDIILNFISSDIVTDWIISDFFPTLLTKVNVNYYMKLNIYEYVDDIKTFIKFKLVTEIFNDRVFPRFTAELSNYIRIRIETYDVDISEANYNLIFKSIPQDKIEGMLDGIFKSSSINNYLTSLFSKYAI